MYAFDISLTILEANARIEERWGGCRDNSIGRGQPPGSTSEFGDSFCV